MLRSFKFILVDGSPVTSSYSLYPVNFPVSSGAKIPWGDPSTFSGSQTLDLVDNVYKVELNRKATSDFYLSLSGSTNPTASANIISGSYQTGSFSTIYFNFIDIINRPIGIHSVEIKPANKNVGFNDSFILEDPVTYTTDGSGTLTVNLVPQPYVVTLKGDRKNTCFTIQPTGSVVTASQVIVSSANVTPNITVKNNAYYGYTAAASDARYLQATGGAISASAIHIDNWSEFKGVVQADTLNVTNDFSFGFNPVAGAVLTSDADGYATWQPTLNDNGGVTSIDWASRTLNDWQTINSVDWTNRFLRDSNGNLVLDWGSSALTLANGSPVLNWANGLLIDSTSNSYNSLDWNGRYLLDEVAGLSLDWNNRRFYDNTTTLTVDYQARTLNDWQTRTSVDWGNGQLRDTLYSNLPSVDWNNRVLYNVSGNNVMSWNNGVTVNGQLNATNISLNNGLNAASVTASAVVVNGNISTSGNVLVGGLTNPNHGYMTIYGGTTDASLKFITNGSSQVSSQIQCYRPSVTGLGGYSSDLVFSTLDSTSTLNENMRITSGGKVGIGVPNPSASLQVNGNISASAVTASNGVQVTGGNTIKFTGVSAQNQASTISTDTSDNLSIVFGGGNGKAFNINSNGTTVVRFADPSVGQTMYGTLTISGSVVATSTSNYFGVVDNIHGAVLNRKVSIDDGTYVGAGGGSSPFASNAWAFSSGNGYNFAIGSANVATIRNSAVGIGHTNPTASLHISGSSSANLLQIASPTSQNILFVSGSGNVGIGTATPSYPLDVSGIIRGTSLAGPIKATVSNAGSQFGAGGANPVGSVVGIQGENYWNGPIVGISDNGSGIGGNGNLLQIKALNNPIFTVNHSGSVGIGTVTPTARLTISGSGTGSADTMLLVNSAGNKVFEVQAGVNVFL